MRTRLVIPLLTFGLFLAAAVGPAAQTAKGKTSTQRSESWKTPWGDPDLQGTDLGSGSGDWQTLEM